MACSSFSLTLKSFSLASVPSAEGIKVNLCEIAIVSDDGRGTGTCFCLTGGSSAGGLLRQNQRLAPDIQKQLEVLDDIVPVLHVLRLLPPPLHWKRCAPCSVFSSLDSRLILSVLSLKLSVKNSDIKQIQGIAETIE